MTDDLAALFAYNALADARLLDACRLVSPERYAAEVEPGWASLRSTVAHIAGATDLWVRRFLGQPAEGFVPESDSPPPTPPPASWPAPTTPSTAWPAISRPSNWPPPSPTGTSEGRSPPPRSGPPSATSPTTRPTTEARPPPSSSASASSRPSPTSSSGPWSRRRSPDEPPAYRIGIDRHP